MKLYDFPGKAVSWRAGFARALRHRENPSHTEVLLNIDGENSDFKPSYDLRAFDLPRSGTDAETASKRFAS